jgi:outer membrane lipoprotein-sorting protein
VFATYIAAVIPALAFLLYSMVKHLPSFVDTTLTAIIGQATALPIAWRSGDFLTFALLTLTVTLLSISVAGMFLVLGLAILPPVLAAWKWTNGVSRRVVPVASATAALAGSIAFLWYPDATRIYQRLSAPAPTRIAMELFERAAQATASISSLSANIQGALGPDLYTGTVTLKRPNLARIDITSDGSLGKFQVISDGSQLHTYFPADNKVVDARPGNNGENVTAFVADQVGHFFRPDSIRAASKRGKVTHAGTLPLDGVTYDLVDQFIDDQRRTTLRYYISQTDRMIHGVTTSYAGETAKWTRLTSVQLNPQLADASFAWQAPEGAGPVSLPAGINLPVGPSK